MGKVADRYLKINPWKIIEEPWNEERNEVSESIFSLANEYMGVRGYFDEDTSAKSMRGTYYNGIYEVEKTEGTSYKGIVQQTHFMINSPDWLKTSISVDDEILQLGFDSNSSNISEYYRELDMKIGTLTRTFVWTTKSNKKMRVTFVRLLNMNRVHFAYQTIKIEALNFSGEAVVTSGVGCKPIHYSREKCYWKNIEQTTDENICSLIFQTLTTNQKLYVGASWKSNDIKSQSNFCNDDFYGKKFILSLEKNKEAVVYKTICAVIDRDEGHSTKELFEGGKNELINENQKDYANVLCEQGIYWNSVWEKSDIEIEGDELDQQGIRFCIFQMNQTYHGISPLDNIGAKGLTGEAYNGNAFWDTETYCLPFYMYSNVAAAKNLLEFRYNTLVQAKKRAEMLDCKGACYPVATLNGDEACNLWQHASCQFQPSTGVAYGIEHYVSLTKDKQFLYTHGIEMLIEISRFLMSRGSWNQDKTGFGFYAVMGPDEFHMMVNNNTYTNFMARKTFNYTLSVIKEMKENASDFYEEIKCKTNLAEEEITSIKLCSEKMIILFNQNTKIFEQHEGYASLPHQNINEIPISDFPLYGHWSYDRIYRSDMIKQPDVLMFLFLYRNEFSLETITANYNYYEPRTIHESSLSPSVHSVLACDIGKKKEAINFFGFATRLDLDNYNRNSAEGLHTTSIAAAWINIVFGFGGLHSEPGMNGIVSIAPVLPEKWEKYSFRFLCRDVFVIVDIDKLGVTVKSKSDNEKSADIIIYGKKYVIGNNEFHIELKENSI